MMKPALPKPTAEYMAAKRAECKQASPCDDDKANGILREQAPFWMNQATLAYSVPNTCEDINCHLKEGTGIPFPTCSHKPNYNKANGTQEYNSVTFDAAIQQVNDMLVGTNVSMQNPDATSDPPPPVGKYLAMGSFFKNEDAKDNDPHVNKHGKQTAKLQGRYFPRSV